MRAFAKILVVWLSFAVVASAGAQTVSLNADADRLVVTVPETAPATIELTGDDLVPISWTRGSTHKGELPLLVLPGAGDSLSIALVQKSITVEIGRRPVPRVIVDESASARRQNWKPTASPASRQTTLLLAVAQGTTVLLAALSRRRVALGVALVAITWTVALALAGTGRPPLVEEQEPSGRRWILANEPQALRVPIDEAVRPVVGSEAQFKAMSPRIVVGDGKATLELRMEAGTRLAFDPY